MVLAVSCSCGAVDGQPCPRQELRNVIDAPTAGLVPLKGYALDVQLVPQGGLLLQVSVGLMDRISVGCSYGGRNIIGEGETQWNPRVGLLARIRVLDETVQIPAMAVGFDSQGHGPYAESMKRYPVKSKGVHVVLSKSFWAAGPLGLHAGCNYSLDDEDGDRDLSGFVAGDKDLPAGFALLAEYDLALNDNARDTIFGAGRGYLNVGVRWTLDEKVSLEFDLKDLADNREDVHCVGREMRIAFWDFF